MRPRTDQDRAESPASSTSSRSDLSSPTFDRDSEFEFNPRTRSETMTSGGKGNEREDDGSFENESDSNSTTTPKTIVSKENLADDVRSPRAIKTPVSLLHPPLALRQALTTFHFSCHQSVPALPSSQASVTCWHGHPAQVQPVQLAVIRRHSARSGHSGKTHKDHFLRLSPARQRSWCERLHGKVARKDSWRIWTR